MREISLEMTTSEAYRYLANSVLGVKASLISLCADIDRYFKLGLNINISESVTDRDFLRVLNIFPFLAQMTLEQFNKLLSVFKDIRDVNAHVNSRQAVYIDDDICTYLTSILEPDYEVSVNGALTLYGEAFVLYFLSQNYNLFKFITSFFNGHNFKEFKEMTGQEKSKYQTSTQHIVQEICGIGKPIVLNNDNKKEYVYMNDLFKNNLSPIIFSIEEACVRTDRTKKNYSFSSIIHYNSFLNNYEEISELIILLRNCWLHGTFLEDEIEYNDEIIRFDYKFILESFIKIKQCFNQNLEMFGHAVSLINKFAFLCLDHYILRIYEVTYKILDNRLLTSDKFDERIKNLESAYNRFSSEQKIYFELLADLLGDIEINMSPGKSKYLDNIPRSTKREKLILIKMISKNGFDIGDYHTDETELVFADVDLEAEYQNKVNGKYLKEFDFVSEEKYGNKISIYSVEIK